MPYNGIISYATCLVQHLHDGIRFQSKLDWVFLILRMEQAVLNTENTDLKNNAYDHN